MNKFKGFEKDPIFILSLYIVEFGYSGQIWPSGRVPLYTVEAKSLWACHATDWGYYLTDNI